MSSGKTVAEQLCIHARTVEDLELLISTLDAMERWGNLSDEYLELSNPERKREFQQMLQQAIDDVTENVNPLCQDWLCRPLNEEEAAEFDLIRTAYLPEIILMYHNSLYLAGCTIGREILAQCMSLSIAIAGSQTLTECFVSAGRMRELVRALAMSSMAIMTLKDPKLKKKLPRNATLDIWKIKPIEEDAVGLTQHWKKG
ncbi:Nucleoporin nup84 [Coccidioides posadasii str. Silveira]|nr:Nucleoporin nup84 [Coccidioides posadasii str. Silveira]